MKRFFGLLLWLALAGTASCQTYINTAGSDDRLAISGFDTVAFFTEKRAVLGKPEFQHEHAGARWLFSSQQNLDLFRTSSDRCLPEW
jgi:hypothetical protein